MCALLVCRPLASSYPLFLVENREEDPARGTAPPGLHDCDGVRAVFPRDRRHGGSWIGCNEFGLVVGLTTWKGGVDDAEARSRGSAVPTVLAARDIEEARDRLAAHCRAAPIRGFQILVCDRTRTLWMRAGADPEQPEFEVREIEDSVVVVDSSHGPGELLVPGLETWATDSARADEDRDVEAVLDHLVVVLATGKLRSADGSGPVYGTREICVTEGPVPTVSSTLFAMPPEGQAWRIRYTPGSPRKVAPRDYSWLAERMLA